MKSIVGVLFGVFSIFVIHIAIIFSIFNVDLSNAGFALGEIGARYLIGFVIMGLMDVVTKNNELQKDLNSVRNVGMTFIYIICIVVLAFAVGLCSNFAYIGQ